MVPISCGTRKVQTAIVKIEDKAKEEIKSSGQVTKETKTQESTEKAEKAAKEDSQQIQKLTELYFENGVLRSRIIELIDSKSIDNTSRSEKSLKSQENRQDSIFNNTRTIERTITIHTKDKKTESNRNGLYAMVGTVLGFALFLWFALKKPRGS
jgi:membrane-associated HD superfamily phosphohydrolase